MAKKALSIVFNVFSGKEGRLAQIEGALAVGGTAFAAAFVAVGAPPITATLAGLGAIAGVAGVLGEVGLNHRWPAVNYPEQTKAEANTGAPKAAGL